MADYTLKNISELPSGSAAGSNFLVQDDGTNMTKVPINDAVAAAAVIGSTALPTTAQTLTGAIAEHEEDISTLTSNTSTTVTLTLSGVSAPTTIRKRGRIVEFLVVLGDGTAFSSATGTEQIGTLPTGYRPPMLGYYPATVRTDGAWASATYYPVLLMIDTDGSIKMRGNVNNLQSCKYLNGVVVFST